MYVLTIDQARSRRSPDRVPELLAALSDVGVLAPFERTVGDEVQGVPADAAAALAAIRICFAEGGDGTSAWGQVRVFSGGMALPAVGRGGPSWPPARPSRRPSVRVPRLPCAQRMPPRRGLRPKHSCGSSGLLSGDGRSVSAKWLRSSLGE